MSYETGPATAESIRLRKLAGSRLRQQELPAWRPHTTACCVVFVCAIIGVAFTVFGVSLVVGAGGYDEANVVRYDNMPACAAALRHSPCYTGQTDAAGVPLATKGVPLDPMCGRRVVTPASTCDVPIVVKKKMEPPIYVYYQLTGFHQNHRRYVQSSEAKQLRGEDWDSETEYTNALEAKCDKYANQCRNGTLPYMKDGVHQTSALDGAGLYWCNPCGSVARSFFTDTFQLKTAAGAAVPWTQTGIAWDSDVNSRFKATPATNVFNKRSPEENALVQDPDFINWMRLAALPEFRKLHRVIDTALEAGTYNLTVTNNFDVSYFGGEKGFLITEITTFGFPSSSLGIAYVVVGILSLVTAAIIGMKEKNKGD